MTSKDKEKLFCGVCGYETDYIGTYAKPPACPKCKILLSFKDSSPISADEAENVPAAAWTLKILALLFVLGSMLFMFKHFQTYDRRALVLEEARFGESFYGGESRSQIGVDWKRTAYSFDVYWNKKIQSRTTMMVREEHWYTYKGIRNGLMEIEYTYTDSKGKKGSRIISLNLSGNTAYLDVPAIPYVKKSVRSRFKLSADSSGSRVRVSRLN